jgi:hypothetical protein
MQPLEAARASPRVTWQRARRAWSPALSVAVRDCRIRAARDHIRAALGPVARHSEAARLCLELREQRPIEWRDGARCAFLLRFDGDREQGGYPRGFHRWPQRRRNAWFAGFNKGYHDRMRVLQEEAR